MTTNIVGAQPPPDIAGIPLLRVTTAHSVYDIDQLAGTFTRQRAHPDAADLSYHPGYVDGRPLPYTEIYLPGIGERMVLIEPGDAYVASTPVVSIEPVDRFDQ